MDALDRQIRIQYLLVKIVQRRNVRIFILLERRKNHKVVEVNSLRCQWHLSTNIILLMLYDIHRRSLSVGLQFILNKHKSEIAKGFKEFKKCKLMSKMSKVFTSLDLIQGKVTLQMSFLERYQGKQHHTIMNFSIRRRTNSNKIWFVRCYLLPIYRIYILLKQYDCKLEDLPKKFHNSIRCSWEERQILIMLRFGVVC